MREEKKLLLEQIQEEIANSEAFVIASYKKLNPDLAAQFRIDVQKTGANFSVVQKRVLIKAAAADGIELSENDLAGHIGVLYAKEDPIAATKAIFAFAEDHKDNLEVLGGHFDGRLCSAEEMKMISKLPSQDEMRAQLLGLFEAPMSQTLSVIHALLTSVPYCLENKCQSEEAGK